MTVTRFLSATLTATLIALFSFSASVHAASPSVSSNAITFTKQGVWLDNIWHVQPDGRALRPLTYLGGKDPVWSPDGSRVVFTNPLSKRLHVVRQDGRVSAVTPSLGHLRQFSPSWSSDGSHIAFIEERTINGSPQRAIIVASIDSAGVKNITGWSSAVLYRSPSWSPDGRHIVYEKSDGIAATLQIADLQTQTSQTLTELSDITPTRQVSWSPNGKKILYNDSENQVYTIWPDGTHRSTISDGDSYDAAWSPDGSKIVFLESHTGEGISVSGVDGTVTQLPIRQGTYLSIDKPVWSPDGKQVLFSMTGTNQKSATDLFTFRVQSGEQRLVAHMVTGGYDW
jgi:Tol biopolymer transport system component